MNTTSKLIFSSILAILVVTLSSGSYSINQVNAQGAGQQEEDESQKGMQIEDCKQLKDKMANDKDAADQYESKDCADLLK